MTADGDALQGGGSTPPYVQVPKVLLQRRDLSPVAKLLYGVLIEIRDYERNHAPAVRYLARYIGAVHNTVLRGIGALERAGLLIITRFHDGHTRNVYQVVPCGSEMEPVPKRTRQRCRNGNGTVAGTNTEAIPKRQQSGPGPSEQGTSALLGLPFLTPEFQRAWSEWVTYRREIRKPLRPSTIRLQLKTLESLGHDKAIESINNSIRNGWIGLFTPDKRTGPSVGGKRLGRVEAPGGKYANLPVVRSAGVVSNPAGGE